MTRQDEIERFLERCAIDQPFLPLQLAEAVSGSAFNVAAAESELLRLLAQNRAYFRGAAGTQERFRRCGATGGTD